MNSFSLSVSYKFVLQNDILQKIKLQTHAIMEMIVIRRGGLGSKWGSIDYLWSNSCNDEEHYD